MFVLVDPETESYIDADEIVSVWSKNDRLDIAGGEHVNSVIKSNIRLRDGYICGSELEPEVLVKRIAQARDDIPWEGGEEIDAGDLVEVRIMLASIPNSTMEQFIEVEDDHGNGVRLGESVTYPGTNERYIRLLVPRDQIGAKV